jgi:hypothetical protein
MLPNMKPTPDTDWMLIVEDQLDLWTLLEAHLKTALPALPLVRVSQPRPLVTSTSVYEKNNAYPGWC